ncbi:hypothetical protein K7H13_13755 [Qipengyuania citrea]|uniref:hypothetical protein n=1 Tax=Qipengyuania citrea TaxID=225971 RepID=UPI001E4CA10B|nr:hypothetical protein [Qipengyuania citrea]MCD1591814.1 hypothetical protein [Qipengyuania citrea]
MRDLGPLHAEWSAKLRNEFGITPAIFGWFDFKSGPVGVWTGTHPITPKGTGDIELDNKTFDPLVNGAPINIGTNNFSYQGSEAFTLSMAIPESPSTYVQAASVDPEEYQARTAILWRAMMVTAPTPGQEGIWAFRRVRAGAMDELSISYNGKEHLFTLTIEAHASMISAATGSNWLDQKRFDPLDTSQDFAVSIANNPSNPSRGAAGGSYGGGGGGGGRGGGGGIYSEQVLK